MKVTFYKLDKKQFLNKLNETKTQFEKNITDKTLDLSKSGMGLHDDESWDELVQLLKDVQINKLNLYSNMLNNKEVDLLFNLFTKLQQTDITHLNIASNSLREFHLRRTTNGSIFSALANTKITHLDFSDNGFLSKNKNLPRAIEDLSKSLVTHLKLECYDFTEFSENFFSALGKTNISHLSLGNTEYIRPTLYNVGSALENFKSTNITHLNLTQIGLFNQSHYEHGDTTLDGLHGLVNSKITHLNLSNNVPEKQPTPSGLKEVIPQLEGTSVTHLNLSNNKLGSLSNEQLIDIISAIPQQIVSINLSHNHLFAGKTEQEIDELLQRLQPYEQNGRLNISNNGESSIARVMAPLISAVSNEQLNEDCAATILTFLEKGNDKEVRAHFKEELMQHTISQSKHTLFAKDTPDANKDMDSNSFSSQTSQCLLM